MSNVGFINNTAETNVDRVDILLERRAVIDVGSGSTKVCIADVDVKANKIFNIILKDSHPVAYQADLESSLDKTFSPAVREAGIKTFQKIESQCQELGVQKVTVIATEAFRKASNQESFIQEIKVKTGLNVRVISQKDEAAIAFYSASALKSETPEDKLIVWDIGTGSSQITIKKESNVVVAMSNVGSVPFKEYILTYKQSSSLHPLKQEDYTVAERFARSLARKAPVEIKHQIKNQMGQIMGVGRLFTNSLAPFAEDKRAIKRRDLRKFIKGAIGKTKEELNDPFSEANVTNATLVLAYMKALHIKCIAPLDAATTQGVLTYRPYWETAVSS
jgi:exopolyphosphatase/guanosine-5'-triphosphate,3'-diphosphate pyrophosphatase